MKLVAFLFAAMAATFLYIGGGIGAVAALVYGVAAVDLLRCDFGRLRA